MLFDNDICSVSQQVLAPFDSILEHCGGDGTYQLIVVLESGSVLAVYNNNKHVLLHPLYNG